MEPQTNEDNGKEKTEGGSQEAPPQGAIIATPQPSERENATSPGETKPDNGKRRYSRWTHPQVIVNGILALAAIVTLVFYSYQFRQSSENFRLDQRAWVAPFEMTMVAEPAPDKEFQTRVSVRNTGKTFAKKVHVKLFGEGHSIDEPVHSLCDGIEDREFEGRGSVLILAPNAQYSCRLSSKKLTDKQSEAIKTGQMAFFLYGRITYEDIFGCTHWTNFAGTLDFPAGTFDALDECNDADDNRCH